MQNWKDQDGDINPPGKKRPVIPGPNGRMTPVPWINADHPYRGYWKRVDGPRALDAQFNHLCIVCGERRGDNWVYALLHGNPYDDITEDIVTQIFGGGSPSPTYGHPECILKAVLYCPHLKKQVYPAMTQDKSTKLTVEDLKRIVKEQKILKKEDNSTAIGSASYTKRPVRIV